MNKLTYTVFTSFMGNTFLAMLKMIAGFLGKSMSLIVDGVHTFADQSLELITISNTKFNKNDKLKHVINISLGLIVLSLGLVFIYIVSKRGVVIPKNWVIVVSFLTIIFKYVLSSYLMEKGKLYHNTILVNDAKQSNKDVISSIIVFLGLSLILLKDKYEYFMYAEMISAIIVSIFVIYGGFVIISRELSDIFGTKVENIEYINGIKEFISNNKNVIEITNVTIQKYGPYYEAKCDIKMDSNLTLKDANRIVKYLEIALRNKYQDMVITINIV